MHNEIKKSQPKGLTLIEVLIAVAIGVLVMTALLTLYIAGQKYFFNQNAKADVIEDSRYPMAWVTRDIREAIQIVSGTVTVDGETYATSSNTLILQLPSVDPGTGEIIDFDTTFDTVIYCQHPTQNRMFQRIVKAYDDSVDTRLMADDVGLFQLTYWTDDSPPVEVTDFTDTSIIATVDITLNSDANGIGRSFQEGLNTQVRLRNKPVSAP
jgi:prepilin-type N-terminal cleavage/methylation domain-containing protein